MAFTTINDPSAQFQTVLWTGNSTDNRSITNTGNANLQPDVVWIKNRNSNQNHYLYDSTRGANVQLLPADGAGETTVADRMQAFETDGFQVGSSSETNYNSYTYVGWQWKATGGTTASNGTGSITSTVQANTTAGFSIVTYTGNATSGATVGHGLGSVPKMVIYKSRSASGGWHVYHASIGAGKALYLNLDSVAATDANFLNDTAPTSTLLTLGSSSGANGSGTTYVAYCFAPIKGYSKFGAYTGNNNADGPFIYTGFKPAWVIIKAVGSTGGAQNWRIADTKRSSSSGNNTIDKQLMSNNTDAEDSGNDVDLLSNGFKVRSTAAQWNANGIDIVYAAFAENPFVATNNVAATAR